MKNATVNAAVLLVAGLVVLLAAMPAQAETIMRVDIPFAFLAGEQMHPAGEYLVKIDSRARLAELRPVDGVNTDRLMLDGTLVSRKGVDSMKGFLRFQLYGSTHALQVIGAPAGEAGFGVKASKAERELARTHGGDAGSVVTVTQ